MVPWTSNWLPKRVHPGSVRNGSWRHYAVGTGFWEASQVPINGTTRRRPCSKIRLVAAVEFLSHVSPHLLCISVSSPTPGGPWGLVVQDEMFFQFLPTVVKKENRVGNPKTVRWRHFSRSGSQCHVVAVRRA